VTLWYYKARVNEPQLGRFLQTDPIGYVDSPNLYNYVLGDPINLIDPLGLSELAPPWAWCTSNCGPGGEVFVTANLLSGGSLSVGTGSV